MRRFLTVVFLALAPLAASAADAPPGQAHIGPGDVLRGHFTETRDMKSGAPPQTSGHFVVAPAYGLIWGIEQPFPTSTIVTADGVAQDLGGVALKLPAKHLRHLYDMVGGALAGDWSSLENDFTISTQSSHGHWQILLTPRPDKGSLPYSSITVSGGRFVENIVMRQYNGTSDSFTFSNAILSPAPVNAMEAASFSKVKP